MEEHSYIYAGGRLLRETVFIVDEQGSEIERTLDFRYDNAGLPYALHYKDDFEGIEQTYYYVTNLQGDVMYIVDESGDEVASYEYDPYGKLTRTTGDMAKTNPIRYRGYYYDNETNFYYLQSRYYDPAICRFINADGYASTGQGIVGYNMFAYCNNNPINCADPTGHFFGGAIAGAVVGIILLGISLSGCSAQQPEPYKTADEAAKAFSEEVYSSSLYIRHEYATEIYSRTVNGVTTYNYNAPRAGSPHEVAVGRYVPSGTQLVAYAHTHPNYDYFSPDDKKVANKDEVNIYVVGPSLELIRYDYITETVSDPICNIVPVALTESQKAYLVGEFQSSWDAHIAEGCNSNCQNKPWPTP